MMSSLPRHLAPVGSTVVCFCSRVHDLSTHKKFVSADYALEGQMKVYFGKTVVLQVTLAVTASVTGKL